MPAKLTRSKPNRTKFATLQDVGALSIKVEANTQAIGTLSTRVDTLTTQVDTLSTRVDTLTTRVDVIAQKTEANTQAIGTLSTRVDTLTTRVDVIAQKTEANTQAINTLSKRVDQNTQKLIEHDSRFDTVDKLLDTIAGEVLDLKKGQDSMRGTLILIEDKIDKTFKVFTEFTANKIDNHEARITVLESKM